MRRALRRHVLVGRHHGWDGERTGFPALSQEGWGELLMLGVGRGEWQTLRPASGVSGPHRLRRTLAPEPSSASLLPLRNSSLDLHSELHEFHEQADDRRHTRPQRQLRPIPEFTHDLEPPCARLFIDRGRSAYANMRIKTQLEAGPRHPLFSHWSGKKGGVSLF